jgi:hypothetical protein
VLASNNLLMLPQGWGQQVIHARCCYILHNWPVIKLACVTQAAVPKVNTLTCCACCLLCAAADLPSRYPGRPVLPCLAAAAPQRWGLAPTTGAASYPSATLAQMCQLATQAAMLAVPWSLISIAVGQAAARLL